MLKIIRKEDFKATSWSGGETTELYIYPQDSSLADRNFIFRISSATCPEEESVFSDFSGYNRYITSLNNNLHLKNKGQDYNLSPYEIFYFDGEDETASKSAVRDFNLIIKKGYTGSLRSESFEDEINFKNISGMNFIISPEKELILVENKQEKIVKPFEAIFINTKAQEIVLKSIDKKYTRLIIVDVEV